jgi:hypothetical protein
MVEIIFFFSRRRPEFDPRPLHLVFTANKVAFGQDLSSVLVFFFLFYASC